LESTQSGLACTYSTIAKKFTGGLKIRRKHAGAGAKPRPPGVTWCKIFFI